MGNVENKFDDEYASLPLTDFAHVEKETKDKRYGDFALYINRIDENKQLAVLSKVFQSDQMTNITISQINDLKVITNSPFLIQTHFVEKKEKSEFCSNYTKVYVGMDFLPFSLEDEIEIRNKKNFIFYEDELWIILHKYIHGLSYLEENGASHLHLEPENFLLGMGGVGKIFFAHPFEEDSIHPLNDKNNVFYSPAMFEAVSHGEIPKHIAQKSDIFSVGQILLQAASGKNSRSLYNFESIEVLHDEIEERINSLNERFSINFKNTLREMLHLDENHRPSYELLKKHNPINENESSLYIDWLIFKEERPKTIPSYKNTKRSMESELMASDKRSLVIQDSIEKKIPESPQYLEVQKVPEDKPLDPFNYSPIKAEPEMKYSSSSPFNNSVQKEIPEMGISRPGEGNPRGPNLEMERFNRIHPKPMEYEPSFMETEMNFNSRIQNPQPYIPPRYQPPPPTIHYPQSSTRPVRYSKLDPETEALLLELREKKKNRGNNFGIGSMGGISNKRTYNDDFKNPSLFTHTGIGNKESMNYTTNRISGFDGIGTEHRMNTFGNEGFSYNNYDRNSYI